MRESLWIRHKTHNVPASEAVLVAIRYGSDCSTPHASQVANVRPSNSQATSDSPAVDRLRTMWTTCASENTPDSAAANTPVITEKVTHAVSALATCQSVVVGTLLSGAGAPSRLSAPVSSSSAKGGTYFGSSESCCGQSRRVMIAMNPQPAMKANEENPNVRNHT
jgi:hypothetical protein